MQWAILFALLLLAGCATTQTPAPLTGPTYAQGFADGKRAARQTLQSEAHVSHYALSACDKEHSWLPKNAPSIPRIQYLRALRHEEDLHDRCVARHDALRAQVKTILGLIRD